MSAYHVFGKVSIFQNKWLLKAARILFNESAQNQDHHDSYNGIKTSENGMFLYKSDQGDAHV